MKSRTIPLIIMVALIAPAVLTIAPAYAQVQAISIVSVTPSQYVHPGEAVTVQVAVGIAGIQYTVALKSCYTGDVWASVTRTAPTAGTYTVTLILPRGPLPGIGAPACLEVEASTPLSTTPATTYLMIAPVLTVNVTKVPDVTETGTPVAINITGYGFDDGAVISAIEFKGPIDVNYSVSATADSSGVFSVAITLLNVTNGYGLPRGAYEIYAISTTTYGYEQKPAMLTIVPQILISPTSGHGRCDSQVCELKSITITGYGFDAKSNITKVTFFNTNFSIPYTFEITSVQTNEYGYFVMTGEQLTQHNVYNMTAGLYNITLVERPATQTFETTATITYNAYNKLEIPPSITEPVLGTPANVTALYYIAGQWTYKTYTTRQSYTKTEVLRIDFVENGHTYELDANLIFNATTGKAIGIQFALYNMSTTPPTTLFTYVNTSPAYDSKIGAYYADIYFNVSPTVKYSPILNATYMYHARFYNYTNMIYLVLEKYVFETSYANLTLYYNNTATKKLLKWFFVYNASNPSASNFTYSNGKLTASVKFVDANIEFQVDFSSVPAERTAVLKLIATPLTTRTFGFNNVYYIVRPLLVLLAPSVVMPGSTLTLAAYGYGPAPNKLTVTLDKKIVLATVTLGKDGNATFTVDLPKYVTFGAHYLWGRDSYGYEYSLAIIVGSKAYWIKLPIPNVVVDTTTNTVTAGYENKTLVVCPYPVKYAGVSFVHKVVYGGKCDYLGDKIEVVVAGLSPGDHITVYFGNIEVATAVANSSGVAVAIFTVPTVPEGSYTIKVVTPYGTLEPQFFNGTTFMTVTANVVPKILLTALDNTSALPILVGPGLVRIIGTGFPAGVGFEGILINGTDAISTFAANVRLWTTDQHGVLTSTLANSVPAVYMPVLEPGAYKISLVYRVGSTLKVSEAGTVYVINNVSILLTKTALTSVATKLEKSISDLSASLSAVEKSILSAISSVGTTISNSISNNVVAAISKLDNKLSTILSTVSALSTIKSDIETIKSVASSLSNTAASLQTTVSKLATTVSSVNSKIASLASTVSSISNAISTLSQNVNTLSSKVDDLSKAVGDVKTSLSSLATSVSDVKSSLSTISKSISSLASDISSVKASIESVKSDVGSLKNAISGITTSISNLKNYVGSEINNLKSYVSSEIGSAKSAIQSSLGTIQILVIVALILALIAAVGSIFGAVQISKKLAG